MFKEYGAFPYNSIMFDSKKDVVRFDEAPDFDTAREPRVGRYVSVDLATGTAKEGKSDFIWHHKWLWVKDDYTGFDVDASREWSRKWASAMPEVAKGTERTFSEQLKKHNIAALLLAVADYFDPVTAAFAKPHDGWKGLKPGLQPLPQPLEGHDKAWKKIAARLGIDPAKGVMQLAPVIGGRRRYHHRPLTSWLLPDKKTTLTLTSDKLEGQSWNRLKNKRHVAMPRVSDVFELRLTGVRASLWAIVHERLTWPVDPDWDVFVDTFFRWRAMQKDALKPAKAEDLEGFLRFIIDPEKSDPVTTRRRRIETALPFKMMNDRRADIAARRRTVWKDKGLQAKIAWAKSTLKFLRLNKIKHRDLDPSNLAKTLKGRTVVTNVAESRSKGTKIGRVGRVSSAAEPVSHDPFGPSPAAPALRTAQAINMLLDPTAPLMEQLQILSTETRNLNMQIHQDADMRAAVLEAAFKVGHPQETVLRGLEKLIDLAERSGGKAVPLAEACLGLLGNGLAMNPATAPVEASSQGWVIVKAAGWSRVKTPEQRSQAAQKAAKTRKARQVPVEVKINGIPVAGAYYPAYNDRVDEAHIYFTSRSALKRLANMPMVREYRTTDDYAWDSQEDYGKGTPGTLASALKGATRVYLRLDRPNERTDGRAGWILTVLHHHFESWASADPVDVQVRKSLAPAPVELPPMPTKMVASANYYKNKRHTRRVGKMQKIIDSLVEDPDVGAKDTNAEIIQALTMLKAEMSPQFKDYVSKKTFKNPETGNKVQFHSLPAGEQTEIYQEWSSKNPTDEDLDSLSKQFNLKPGDVRAILNKPMPSTKGGKAAVKDLVKNTDAFNDEMSSIKNDKKAESSFKKTVKDANGAGIGICAGLLAATSAAPKWVPQALDAAQHHPLLAAGVAVSAALVNLAVYAVRSKNKGTTSGSADKSEEMADKLWDAMTTPMTKSTMSKTANLAAAFAGM